MVERFNGRVQREVLSITIRSHAKLATVLRGFNQAYIARRQRVLDWLSPEMILQQRLSADQPSPTRDTSRQKQEP